MPVRDLSRHLTCHNSLAGLWSALVAADHFEDVLIIEPESWLHTEEGRSNIYDEDGTYIENSRQNTRTRVMQYNAIHGMGMVIALERRSLTSYNPSLPTNRT